MKAKSTFLCLKKVKNCNVVAYELQKKVFGKICVYPRIDNLPSQFKFMTSTFYIKSKLVKFWVKWRQFTGVTMVTNQAPIRNQSGAFKKMHRPMTIMNYHWVIVLFLFGVLTNVASRNLHSSKEILFIEVKLLKIHTKTTYCSDSDNLKVI